MNVSLKLAAAPVASPRGSCPWRPPLGPGWTRCRTPPPSVGGAGAGVNNRGSLACRQAPRRSQHPLGTRSPRLLGGHRRPFLETGPQAPGQAVADLAPRHVAAVVHRVLLPVVRAPRHAVVVHVLVPHQVPVEGVGARDEHRIDALRAAQGAKSMATLITRVKSGDATKRLNATLHCRHGLPERTSTDRCPSRVSMSFKYPSSAINAFSLCRSPCRCRDRRGSNEPRTIQSKTEGGPRSELRRRRSKEGPAPGIAAGPPPRACTKRTSKSAASRMRRCGTA